METHVRWHDPGGEKLLLLIFSPNIQYGRWQILLDMIIYL